MTRADDKLPLSDREAAILGVVVRGYVESTRAVGSRWVARHSGLGLSPASIRNCMMDLEERGLLTHLHTSGGRLPTNLGFRAYVDGVMKHAPLARRHARAVDEALGAERFGSLETLLEAACVVLGRLSDQLSVVLSPRYDRSVVDRIELSQVDERRVLVVFRMSTGLERTVIATLAGEVGSQDLRATLLALNAVARGRTLAEIVALGTDEETRVHLRGLALVPAVLQGARQLGEDEGSGQFHLWGTSNILAQPEFADIDRSRAMFQALEAREVLCGLLEPTRHRRSVQVTIGEELPVAALRQCSVVSGSYRFGEFGGSIGVIGPTRMSYDHVVALVDYVAGAVANALARN
jgi:heat-inducible transcriptional repressor